MTKQEVIQDAQKYANMIGRSVYLLRRGTQYIGSANEQKGWSVAEIIAPTTQTRCACFIPGGIQCTLPMYHHEACVYAPYQPFSVNVN
jgi:hypothetical protein